MMIKFNFGLLSDGNGSEAVDKCPLLQNAQVEFFQVLDIEDLLNKKDRFQIIERMKQEVNMMSQGNMELEFENFVFEENRLVCNMVKLN